MLLNGGGGNVTIMKRIAKRRDRKNLNCKESGSKDLENVETEKLSPHS